MVKTTKTVNFYRYQYILVLFLLLITVKQDETVHSSLVSFAHHGKTRREQRELSTELMIKWLSTAGTIY